MLRLLTIAGLVMLLACAAAADELSDADVEYISNVVSKLDSYITWPEGANLEGNGDLMVVTAIGSSSLFDKLKELNGKKTDEGKTTKFRVVEPDWMPANSHVLIFCGLEAEKTRKLIGMLEGKGSLCITLGEGNASLGSTVNFVSGNPKVQTELNLKVAKREGFDVKPSFLKVAKVIEN